jgi:hypothetical protein
MLHEAGDIQKINDMRQLKSYQYPVEPEIQLLKGML